MVGDWKKNVFVADGCRKAASSWLIVLGNVPLLAAYGRRVDAAHPRLCASVAHPLANSTLPAPAASRLRADGERLNTARLAHRHPLL
ncbi:hypothetical protein FFY45_05385 [Xanthomonas hortorum]|nr:hypothetical protein [Xanthomonas hortorum]